MCGIYFAETCPWCQLYWLQLLASGHVHEGYTASEMWRAVGIDGLIEALDWIDDADLCRVLRGRLAILIEEKDGE